MLTAIALTPRDQIAGHFGKAAMFAIYDQQGQLIDRIQNSGSRELGCKHKKILQRQLAAMNVTEIVLGNIGTRSLARLLQAGFNVSRVAPRTSVADFLAGNVNKEALLTAEQGRACKREKGACGCGCGTKKSAPAVAKVGMLSSSFSQLGKIGGLKL
ncbi:NifB/NifX family molybdenum-iron cluster-binding protein [Photobacterium toruni]|uniref:Dinitrogenase iron-molybdenum cofactor n=1 Tax=Photobacterium toruni TaxID=1935446 RepID=A0A1T4U008_9GAMM|nr:NifB/NifX family molybdenum-iron cluster-binding protein [Photobacterium toruni]SKA46067.1 Dinitrogenase iron-molybdenum cofactor [Photobacterium toruni]